jgi:putative NADH-flavin reductase
MIKYYYIVILVYIFIGRRIRRENAKRSTENTKMIRQQRKAQDVHTQYITYLTEQITNLQAEVEQLKGVNPQISNNTSNGYRTPMSPPKIKLRD